MPAPPRIAFWVNDLIRGGTEGQCARVAIGLARQGLPPRFLVFHRHGFFLDRVEKECGRAYEVTIRHAVRPHTLAAVAAAARWLKCNHIDFLHTWDADAAVFGQFAAQLAGIPLVTSRRDLGEIYPRWKRHLLARADARALRVVVNATAIRDHFARQGLHAAKMVLLPNLLDLDERDREAAAAPDLPPDAPAGIDWAPGAEWRLAVVNRLDPEKNTALLLRALAHLRPAHPEARLWVVGDGPERHPLQALARELGVADAVAFWGERHDVASLLRHVRAGALVPQANEGLSNTILEYMAASLPVLATNCGGNRELVADGRRGLLLPRLPSPAELADAWTALLDAPVQAAEWGHDARHFVEAHFSPSAVLPRFEALYRSLPLPSSHPLRPLPS